jgi:hypothetical protein
MDRLKKNDIFYSLPNPPMAMKASSTGSWISNAAAELDVVTSDPVAELIGSSKY